MKINRSQLVSMTEAEENFSLVAKKADKEGSVFIVDSYRAKYLVLALEDESGIETIDSQELMEIAREMIEKNHEVYKKLAE